MAERDDRTRTPPHGDQLLQKPAEYCECSATVWWNDPLVCTYPKCPFGEWEKRLKNDRRNDD